MHACHHLPPHLPAHYLTLPLYVPYLHGIVVVDGGGGWLGRLRQWGRGRKEGEEGGRGRGRLNLERKRKRKMTKRRGKRKTAKIKN